MDDAIFIVGKLAWGVLEPGSLLLIGLAGGLACLFLGRVRLGRWFLGAVLLVGLAVTILPLGEWLLRPLEARHVPPSPLPGAIAGIMLLGGGLDPALTARRGPPALTGAGDRIVATALLARHYPATPILLLGGSGRMREQVYREAPAVAALLVALGTAPDRLVADDKSRTTRENAGSAAAFGLDAGTPDRPWLLVTSAWHMPRAMNSFAALNGSIRPYPVDYLTDPTDSHWFPGFTEGLSLLGLAMKEWLGLAAYAILPRPGESAARP
ncbi:YdcF family protein [Oceanibaculum pacificum]|uniref:DUF218 domain-containing protein n=1 Tax=Oceanibaculum pacificum TaxID=580166 RepID=A0A154W8J8_9PROT|nr:YdcF family protein [Oceanibaculum pacificum]KZD09783.1 hypothetical protein AUP43_00960 [Oceanibaculum pacificum]